MRVRANAGCQEDRSTQIAVPVRAEEQANLFPLTSAEITGFDLGRYLLYGGLPQVYDAEYPEEELDAYVNTYLREEIRGEALVRNFVHFARFLHVAALCSGQQLNFANVSRDTGVPATSVSSYFEILADTVEHVVFHKKSGLKPTDMTPSAWIYGQLKRFRAGIEAG